MEKEIDGLVVMYALLVSMGGIIGLIKGGSVVSLVAGTICGVFLLYGGLYSNSTHGSAIVFWVSVVLLVIMGRRFIRTGKVFPAGIVAIIGAGMAFKYGNRLYPNYIYLPSSFPGKQ